MRYLRSIALLLLGSAALWYASTAFRPASPLFQYDVIWKDNFNQAEKAKLTEWINGVGKATTEVLGKYPFKVNIYMHRKNDAREPVPWANTVRDDEQGVHFHVDPSYPLKDFQEDWTAAHEISHLSIPYIGREHMWFSEGYASFMQWKILEQQGIYSEDEVNEKYAVRLQRAMNKYDEEDRYLAVYQRLRKRFDYPAVYWGGACYFFQVDAELQQKHNLSLPLVIQAYQRNGRMKEHDLEALIMALDKLSESHVFGATMTRFKTASAREAIGATPLPGRS